MDFLLEIWRAGVAAVHGEACVRDWQTANPDFRPTHLAAVGKAAPEMARGAIAALGHVPPGIVITKHGHGADAALPEPLRLIESSHPVPDESSLAAGDALHEFVSNCPPDARLLFLVSGGASALLERLREGFSLSDLERLNREMLADALDIVEMNRRRRQISTIKGGGLLACFRGEALRVLAISDVPGDDIAVIGSGIGGIGECDVSDKLAEIVASNEIARNAARDKAVRMGFSVIADVETLHGELANVAADVSRTMIEGASGIYLFGGEPYLKLPEDPGEGGRNQALALEVARLIDGRPEIGFLAAGTDGGDGPGNAAGGFVTGLSWREIPGGENARIRADSGTWLRNGGCQIVTGPTGTNVMDLAVGLKR